MKKIKYLILVSLLYILCGCSAEYNLNITENTKFTEHIVINASSQEDLLQLNNFNWDVPLDYQNSNEAYEAADYNKNEIYNIVKNQNNVVFDGSFNRDTILNSKAIHDSVDYFNFTKYDGNYVISTSDNFKIFNRYNLEYLVINIKLPNEVINSNADSVNGNVYTWNISKDNKKGIYLEYKPIDNKEITGTKEEDNNLKYILIAIGFLVFLLVGLIFIKKNKYKQ